jgi:hypothetical protein
MNKALSRTTLAIVCIAFFMPVIASSIGMRMHGDANATDAGVAPLLIGVYNIPFMIGALIALTVGTVFNAKGKYNNAKIAYIITLVICAVSLVMVIPWGLKQ